ncbi:uncharacterized protein LOC111134668 isoform X2 [Crassostrea virginica]
MDEESGNISEEPRQPVKAVKNHYYPQQATPYNTPQHPCLSSTTLECHSASSQQCGPGMPSLLASHSSAALECHRSRHLTAVWPWNAIAPGISQQCGPGMPSLLASHSSAALKCYRSRHLTAVRPWNAIYPSIISTA